ncbi:hypothetical protein PDE_07539 [Penicillium oxalicum 114-2]|uniref:Asparaginase n=1 Tax=Penicillium oxalicum (strain 114-2 / CGMCC 5302) TaxID=933388 RepID=S7ZQ82_PENO1|nr:hypothetical protein PDE_07539 [Penicillium oxalicum 114-2]
MTSLRQTESLYAIFVHAGAGYHSHENEDMHLEACRQAIEAGMSLLRNGATAVDAVEMAIMTLEDTPVTNAGYGSNLNALGEVEGDASIVDHFGRSGACGAVPTVKNPIMLARKIYDQAYRNPGLARVPPNFLVGQGAADFAWDNGVLLTVPEHLIAPGPRARYEMWCKDIAAYEAKHPEKSKRNPFLAWVCRPSVCPTSQTTVVESGIEKNVRTADDTTQVHQSDYVRFEHIESTDSTDGHRTTFHSETTPETTHTGPSGTRFGLEQSVHPGSSVLPPTNFHEDAEHSRLDNIHQHDPRLDFPAGYGSSLRAELGDSISLNGTEERPSEKEDSITDTVGVIAVDKYGNIAAGSSSGGIGMKHRGRVGPAALIGIGTHVTPVDPTDSEKATVAVCTSGTGEHISSTFAASTCANRVYYAQRKDRNGRLVNVSEEEAITEMIKNEFARHPAVINSDIGGSIGIMCVKKTIDGIALFFAHNSDSFAVASMSSCDEQPSCIMSRITRSGATALGGTYFQYPEPAAKIRKIDRT